MLGRRHCGPVGLVITVVPMLMGVVYAVRPTEAAGADAAALAASLFAGLAGFTTGPSRMRSVSSRGQSTFGGTAVLGMSEALVPLLLAFGCLTVGWLCVALGMSRQT
jgi:hypothetical protein